MLRKEDVIRDWYSVSANGRVLGRLASEIASKLMGKYKPTYTPHIDGGDFVVVTDASKVAVSGKKFKDKLYYKHSGYPGNLKKFTFESLIEKRPERVISLAVRRMLPKNKLGSQMLRRLKVYSSVEHPHTAQNPKEMKV